MVLATTLQGATGKVYAASGDAAPPPRENAGADGRGYLARTYYAEVEYVLPGAVMQPVWSSVKRRDGSVDFGLSYHRAFYSPDYDDYHDIYLQR